MLYLNVNPLSHYHNFIGATRETGNLLTIQTKMRTHLYTQIKKTDNMNKAGQKNEANKRKNTHRLWRHYLMIVEMISLRVGIYNSF